MLHLLHAPSLFNFFLDFVNYFFVVLVFYYFLRSKVIDLQLFLCLVFCTASPFLINHYVIEWGFMPDQAKYFNQANTLRNFEFDKVGKLTTIVPSIFYAIFPIPFIETINSIAFINKCILGLTVIFLYHKRVINKFWFFLINLWPSIVFYSSVSLKDTIILCLLLLFAYFQNNGNNLKSWIIVLILIPIKVLFSFILASILIYKFFYSQKLTNFKIILLFGIILLFVFLKDDIAFQINDLRYGFYYETYSYNYKFDKIVVDLYFPIQILSELLRFTLSPFPNIHNFSLLVQFIENIIFYSLILFLLIKLYLIDKSKFLFWFTSLIYSLSFLSVLLFSNGTIARYKYTILIYFVFIIYLEIKNRDKKFKII